MKNNSVLTVGTVALDDIQTPAGTRHGLLGGSAVYFSMAARFLSVPHIVAPIGSDFPKNYLDMLCRHNIDLTSVMCMRGKSFRWSGSYGIDFCGATTIWTKLGVLEKFSPVLTPGQRRMKYVFLANIDPRIQLKLLDSLTDPKIVAVDTMNYWISNTKKELLNVLKKADVFLANEEEVKQLSGERSLLRAVKSVKKIGMDFILVKKGENGVLLYCDDFMFFVPGYPLERIVDPTGAGDSFAGAFISYLAASGSFDKRTLEDALLYSCVMASFTVGGFGVAALAGLNKKIISGRAKLLSEMLVAS